MVMKYMAHDLVFLLINIEEMHWHLAVVNRKRCEIQVLDSLLGPMSRDDLGHVQFYQRMQTNGVSCGLFLLNFMEYWTGKKLSDTFMQSDMTNFRLKLAAILCDSTLNTAKELPDGGITDDYTFDTTEFVIENQTQLSQLTCIRYKHIAVAVCDYVLSIKDADALVKEWVRSSDPYPISLSLKNLQDILDVNRSMDIDVFNLAVRMLACDMATVLREPKSHFMDLMFSYICGYRRHPHNRVKHDPKSLSKFFDDWPRSRVSFFECRLKITRTYDRAMDEIDPSWNDNIYDWNHIYPCLLPKTFDRCLTGFLVIELMNMWDGERIHGLLNVDSRLLRKWLLIEVPKQL
ncbi:hypothetical protein SETIT_9G321700v2 [Setaria italica]|uniref:Ubiquitin-like protease family profile domain-containing protein n=1 Tax=Setaria italica TaxID=4555 RepID=A0A368SN11_SETIT|nr:hypothetical protein SETIT_9G321700v2 [Setaria italica]